MRKLIVTTLITLDGYHEGPGGNVMALPFDDGFSAYNVERLRTADTLVMGRTTFEAFKAYWPSVKDDPTQPLVEREISRLNTAAEKIVVSDTVPLEQSGAWGPTRVVRRADAHAEIAKLKQLPGKDLLTFGSHYVWNDLLTAGLVDELHIMLGPSLLAGGTPAFEHATASRLTLLEARRLPDSQLVLLRYAPASASR